MRGLINSGQSKNSEKQQNSFIKDDKSTYKSSNPISSNPILTDLNILNRAAQNVTTNRMYGGYNNIHVKSGTSYGFEELSRSLATLFENKRSINELFYALHNILTTQFATVYTAFGICNEDGSCINLKLIDSVGATYSNKIFFFCYFCYWFLQAMQTADFLNQNRRDPKPAQSF